MDNREDRMAASAHVARSDLNVNQHQRFRRRISFSRHEHQVRRFLCVKERRAPIDAHSKKRARSSWRREGVGARRDAPAGNDNKGSLERGSEPSKLPRYRIIPSAPEGQYREAVVRAENTPFKEIAPRVWIFPTDVPDGEWGANGRITRLPDIHAMLVGETERSVGEKRLARTRRGKARISLEAPLDAARTGSDEA